MTALTCSSNAATLRPPCGRMRSASVLTKKPISDSSSLRGRFATGVPITTSSCPLKRLNRLDQPASKVMNSVAP